MGVVMRKKVISILRWIGLMPAYFLAFFMTAAITSTVYKFAAGSSFIDYGTGSLSYNLDRVATFGFASFAGLYAVCKVAPDFNQRVVSVIAWTIILLNVLGMALGILFLPDRSYDYLAQTGIVIGSAAGLIVMKKYRAKSDVNSPTPIE
jgi:hypothetical protein